MTDLLKFPQAQYDPSKKPVFIKDTINKEEIKKKILDIVSKNKKIETQNKLKEK